jgi:glycosyltransferase involved in cell wall biosynthesis
MPRHIVYLITEDWFFASHFLSRATAALAMGYRVSVLCRTGEAALELRQAGITVIDIAFVRARLNPLAEAAMMRRIAREYRALKPDLVHHIALKPIVLGTLAARLAGVRAVVNAPVGLGYVFTSERAKARALRLPVSAALRATLGARNATAVFENDEDRGAMIAQGLVRREATVLIPGAGVDMEQFHPHPEPPSPVKIILVARMLRDKGVAEFVAAARLLKSRGIAAEFLLVGGPDPGNPNSFTEAELRGAAADGAVDWLGSRRDIAALLAASHIACLPSYREGLPKSLLEAMASGLPCVATDVPGCRSLVIAGQTGLLVPPRDARSLADALAILIADPELRARLGAAGRQRAASEFADPVICAATLEVYDRAIKQGNAP